MEFPLDHFLDAELHIVAQIVEAEFVVGAVSHVAGIGGLAFVVLQPVGDAADGETEEFVYLAHPFGVARRQIVVDRDDVHALAGDGVQIDGQGGDQGLALAGAHFGNLSLMQHHAAQQLDVVVALAQCPLGGFAYGGERVGQQIVQIGAVLVFPAEFVRARAQLVVRQFFHIGFERIDLRHDALQAFDFAIIGAAEKALRDRL